MKNKKGDIPTIVLVIGIFAVCAIGIISFFIADFHISNSFVGVQIMQRFNAQVEEYNFYLNQGISPNNLKGKFNITKIDGKEYFYMEIPYKSSLFGKKSSSNSPLFSVRYPVPN